MADKILQFMEKMYVEFSKRFENIEGEVKGVKSDIADIKADVTVLKDDVGGLKLDVTALKDDVSGLKIDVGILKDDVSGLKTDVTSFKDDMSGLKTDVKELKVGQRKLEIKIENEISEKIKALYDDRADVKEMLTSINMKLDNISEKVDRHDIKIQVIEGGKNKKTI